jgi:hypothetical protein
MRIAFMLIYTVSWSVSWSVYQDLCTWLKYKVIIGPWHHELLMIVVQDTLGLFGFMSLCMSLLPHVTADCKSAASFLLRNIYKIRKYLTLDSTIAVIHAFITSKLEYCNALLFGLPIINISLKEFSAFRTPLPD